VCNYRENIFVHCDLICGTVQLHLADVQRKKD